jgi:hypothetical protein
MGRSSAVQCDDVSGPRTEAQRRRSMAIAANLVTPNSARFRPARLLSMCGVLLAAAVTVGTGLILSNLRERALIDSESALQNIALVVAEQTERAFQAIDFVRSSLI